MLLTIVVPTANRQEFLPETIANLVEETMGFQLEIQIIIADNANEDIITLDQLNLGHSVDRVKVVRFNDRVGVEESIVRSSLLADTEYVWVFGDDDRIIEGCFPHIYEVLDKNRPDYLYLNRYIINHDLTTIERTEHIVEFPTVIPSMNGKEAIIKFHHHAGFITSLISKTGLFKDCEADFKDRFAGYSFLASLYFRTLNGKVSYISQPVLLQRRSKSLWRSLWIKYWLVTIPSLFHWLDQNGVEGSFKVVMKDVNRNALYTAIVAKASNIRPENKIWNDAIQYQITINKICITIIRYLLPERLAKVILNIKNFIIKR